MKETAACRILVAGTVVLLVFRLALSLVRSGPLLVADEVGYLINARVLAGGTPGQMGTEFFRGGYSLLLAPLLAIDGNPVTSYRLVLALNAVLAASLAPLLYLLLTRCFRCSPGAAVWPALAAAVYPTVTVFSQVALSENLLLPLTVVWLICFGKLLDARSGPASAGWGIGFGACAVALLAVHGRMATAAALSVAALVFLALRRRVSGLSALLGLGVMACGYLLVRRLDAFLISANNQGKLPSEAGVRLANLDSVSGWLAVARNVLGETWYVMVATLGVFVIYVITGGLRELGGIRRRDAGTPQLVLGLLLATGVAVLVVSALSFRDLERADTLIYGRYVEVVVPPLLAIALVRLTARRWRPGLLRMVVAIMTISTLAAVALRLAIHPSEAPNRWNIASLPFLTLSLGPVSFIGAGVVAVAAAAALVVVGRRRPAALAPLVLVLFLPTTAVVEHNPVLSGQHAVYPNGWTSPGVALGNARLVAYDLDHYDVFGRYSYQWFMPHTRFVLFSGSTARPPVRYVISSRAWASDHPALHARALWDDPGRDQTLFRIETLR